MKSFGLRSLFILVALCAVCFAAISWLDILGPTGDLFRLERIPDNDSSSVSFAMSKLRSEDLRVRKAAIRALGRIGPTAKSSIPELLRILAKASPQEAPDAAWAIGLIGPTNPDVVAGLRDALKSKNAETRRYAAYAVGLHRGVTPLIPELIALLDDDRVAGTAAHSLSMMGPGGTVAVPQLTGLLSSDNDANAPAALALSQLSAFIPLPSSTIEKIKLLTNHPDDFVRKHANSVLETIEVYWPNSTSSKTAN